MTEVLNTRGLIWGVWDHQGVVAAAVQDMLFRHFADTQVRPRMLRSETPQQLERWSHTPGLGLAMWVLSKVSPLTEICQAISAVRDRQPETVCVCYLEYPGSDLVSLLVEAGGQVIVSDLPTLQRALPRIATQTPLSAQGYHPLTTGLIDRLPFAG